jgi:hypothetical protein
VSNFGGKNRARRRATFLREDTTKFWREERFGEISNFGVDENLRGKKNADPNRNSSLSFPFFCWSWS